MTDPITPNGASNGWEYVNFTPPPPPVSDAIINPLTPTAEADLYAGADTVYVAANGDTAGVVKIGDVLIEANASAPATDYDINGDGKVDKRVKIGDKFYYIIESGVDNAALVAKYGAGTYLPVVNRDVTGDGLPDTGYIRINPDGTKSYVHETTMTDLKNPPAGTTAAEKEVLKKLDGNNDSFAWVGNSATYKDPVTGITYTATIIGYTDSDGDGHQDKFEPMTIVITQSIP